MKQKENKNQTLVEQHFYKMLIKNEKSKATDRRGSVHKLKDDLNL